MFARAAAFSVFVVTSLAVFSCSGAAAPQAQPDDGEGGDDSDGGVVDAGKPDHAAPKADAAEPPGRPPAGVDAAAPDGSTGSRGPKGCIDDVKPGHHDYTCQGIHMDVEIPTQCATAGACGLVVDSHGLSMDAKMEDDNTNMRALGAKYGFVIVQPNANPAPPLSSWNASTDDQVLYQFILDAITALGIDPKRVHMTGFSDGGEASWRFLCAHADLFASVAPAAGAGCSFTGTDKPSREVPVLYMHGTQDALEDFQTVAVPLRDSVVAGWNMGKMETVAQGAGYVRTRWTSPSGTPFEFLQHDYAADSFLLGGHCFPGSTDKGDESGQLFAFHCIAPNAFNWGEEAMKFFVAHD
jgi:dienelactone hydrolase